MEFLWVLDCLSAKKKDRKKATLGSEEKCQCHSLLLIFIKNNYKEERNYIRIL